jgi:hypothetical protein
VLPLVSVLCVPSSLLEPPVVSTVPAVIVVSSVPVLLLSSEAGSVAVTLTGPSVGLVSVLASPVESALAATSSPEGQAHNRDDERTPRTRVFIIIVPHGPRECGADPRSSRQASTMEVANARARGRIAFALRRPALSLGYQPPIVPFSTG